MSNMKEARIMERMTVKDLRAEAKAQGITGTSKMNKDDLITELLALKNKKSTKKTSKKKPLFDKSVKKVHMYAFTGMYIGEFEAEYGDEYMLVYTEKRGELAFDTKTGIESTTKAKARYANRIERA